MHRQISKHKPSGPISLPSSRLRSHGYSLSSLYRSASEDSTNVSGNPAWIILDNEMHIGFLLRGRCRCRLPGYRSSISSIDQPVAPFNLRTAPLLENQRCSRIPRAHQVPARRALLSSGTDGFFARIRQRNDERAIPCVGMGNRPAPCTSNACSITSLREHVRRFTGSEFFPFLQYKDAVRVLSGQIQVVKHGQYAGRLTGEVACRGQDPVLVREIQVGGGFIEQKVSPAVGGCSPT